MHDLGSRRIASLGPREAADPGDQGGLVLARDHAVDQPPDREVAADGRVEAVETEGELGPLRPQRLGGPQREAHRGVHRDREGDRLAPLQPLRIPALDCEDASPLDRQHHHTGRGRLTVQVRQREPEGVAEDHLLQRRAGPEAQRTRAQAPDRTGGELQDPRPVAVEAQLGVDRALAQPQRVGRRLRQTLDPLLRLGGQPRGSDVDRLLEVGALERIRLVERRVAALSRDAETAWGGLQRRPIRAQAAAAARWPTSSTATTASSGARRWSSSIAWAAASGARSEITSARSPIDPDSAWRCSEATTTSALSTRAAARKSGARYVLVGRIRSTRGIAVS